MITKILAGILTGIFFLFAAHIALSDEDAWSRFRSKKWVPGVAPATNELYLQECGSCHFAYQPGLLPGDSWKRLVGDLSNHFGDNAEMAPDDLAVVTDYLVGNAADHSDHERPIKIMRSLKKGEPPLRITDVPYIKHKHHELSPRMVEKNKKVMTLGNCSACHTEADSGRYNESTVNIPGFGKWDD